MPSQRERLRAEIDFEFHMAEAHDALAAVYSHLEKPLDRDHHVAFARGKAALHRRNMDAMAKRYVAQFGIGGWYGRLANKVAAFLSRRAGR